MSIVSLLSYQRMWQVKIKRKHRLVKKELDPIISKDDELEHLPETEGLLFAVLLYTSSV